MSVRRRPSDLLATLRVAEALLTACLNPAAGAADAHCVYAREALREIQVALSAADGRPVPAAPPLDVVDLRVQVAHLQDLLRELRHHDLYDYGPWTGGMQRRVGYALGESGFEPGRRFVRPTGLR